MANLTILITFTGILVLPWAIYVILTFKFTGINNIAKHKFYGSYGPQGYGILNYNTDHNYEYNSDIRKRDSKKKKNLKIFTKII